MGNTIYANSGGIRFSKGNRKLPKTTAILYITSAKECPSKKRGLCQIPPGKCYALKAERLYKYSRPYRDEQTCQWDGHLTRTIAEMILWHNKHAWKYKVKLVRFNEAGDFRGQRDIDKMSRLAHFLKRSGIKVYGYTARKDLDFSNVDSNMIVNGSGFMVHNKIIVVPKKELHKFRYRCKMNCRICNLCTRKKKITIHIPLH